MNGWQEAVEAWAVALRAAGRAATTIATRTDHVMRLGRAIGCGPWEVTGPSLVVWEGHRKADAGGVDTPHPLRHRFATRAYAVDRDLLAVQTLLGHASPVTTRRYVAVPDESLRRTVLSVA